jgi:hypothetical protein
VRSKNLESEGLKTASSANRDLLSIGAFLVILVVGIVLGAMNLVSWWLVPPLIIALSGCWVVALGAMQASSPQKYAYSAFSLFGWGLLLIAVGGAWFLYGFGLSWAYSLAVILLVLAVLAVAAALRRK